MLFIATNFFCAIIIIFFGKLHCLNISYFPSYTIFLKRLLAIRKGVVTLGSLNSIFSIISLWLITYISSEICDLCA
jgi:hypothetical protein